ncbi:MarR family winged helix-turn-helix transcriptional regulator [Luteibaculum oceani]|uniref:MarR family transcriptional regulator n=1 Tax=Luteibaculum oceani TaxID=1294296 RepID=A0A5C6UQF6_9FLAO|nr:MarR family transcriptional regulator [Luteibaculum oceani]TXC75573.1 MarR family transcriptional regulator [Luteibaculum oceani]
MKIEEAIKQKKFSSEVQRAQINILYTASFLNSVHSQLFKEYDLSAQQYNVLRIINGQDPKPASVQLINERMIDASSNVSRIVDKLVAKKWVTRTTCRRDRRQVDIKITPKAKELIAEVHEQFQERFKVLDEIPTNELELLNDTLDKMRGLILKSKS